MNDHSGISLAAGGTGHALRPEDLGFGPLFWAVRDALIVGDVASGRIVLWNPAAERVFGYPAEDAIGLPIEVLFPERLRDQFRAGLARYAAEGHGVLADTEGPRELPALHRSGAEIVIEFSVSPLESPDVPYVLGLVRDCTERKRIERERDILLASAQDYARRLGELATLKADFTAMVAHELGTPLAAIRALIDLLDRDGIAATDRQHILATIRTEIHLVQRLVADVHATATFERDDFAVRPQPTAVATLLAEAAASMQGQLANHDFHVDPAPLTRVLADHERIGQVLRNLLGNAAKHTPPGTPVTVRATRADGRVHIEITDRGSGIHPDDLSRIFSKFGRGRDAQGQRLPGVGLGLYLSRRIVQAHGGALVVVSEPDTGTTFSFDLEEVS